MRRSAFLGLLAAAGCAHRRAAIQPFRTALPGVRIVALGDSLAFGTGASSPEHAFIFRAYERLRDRRPASEIANFAMGGSTARDVLRLQVPRLAGARFDIVVICVGGNDVVHRVDPATFAQTYTRLLAAVRRVQPAARIVCCGVPNVGISPLFAGLDHAAVTQLARADDDAVRAAAHARADGFVDLFAVTSAAGGGGPRGGGAAHSDDRFHPGDAGYAQMADALAPALVRAADVSRPSR